MRPDVVVEQFGFGSGDGVAEQIYTLSTKVVTALPQTLQQSVGRQYRYCHNNFLAQQPHSACSLSSTRKSTPSGQCVRENPGKISRQDRRDGLRDYLGQTPAISKYS